MFNNHFSIKKDFVNICNINFFNKFIIAFILGLSSLLFSMPAPALAASGDETTIGTLSLSPAFENIGVISSFSGDNNANNQAILEYRQTGTTDWTPGIQMTGDRRTSLTMSGSSPIANPYKNQWRAVIFWLTPSTSYDVRVTYTDADGGSGTVQGTVTTLNDTPPSTGSTYYVAKTGSDTTGNGSEATPWLTIGKAASSVAAGATVNIKPGTYSEQVVMSKSGTVNNYITFKSYDSSNKAIITSAADTGTFNLSNDSYIRLKELDIKNTGEYPAVYIDGTSAIGNIIEDCNLSCVGYNWWSAGVWISNGPTRTLVQRNQITTTTSATGDGPQGVFLWSTGGSTVIRDNVMTGKYNNAVGGEDNCSVNGGPYLNTYIYRNTVNGADGDGIETDGGGINCAVWSNTIKNTGFSGISVAPIIVGPMYIFRNTVLPNTILTSVKMGSNSGGYLYFYHNTFYVVSGYGNGIATYGNDAIVNNAVFRNNIFQVSDYLIEELDNGTGAMNFDYDCMYTSDSSLKWKNIVMTYANWRTNYNEEAHGVYGQAKVVSSSDMHLQSSSPCIDKGVLIPGFNDANSPWPYRGAAPDMGAYEYDSGAPTNSLPVAVNDAYSTSVNTTLNISAPGVLSNDTDANGDTLTAVLVSSVSHGSLTLNSNGSFNYIPSTGYSGTDSFTYKANDSQADSNTATVTITVSAVNNAPVAVNDAYSTNEDTALNRAAPGVLSNDTDADGDNLTAVKVSNPSHGSVTLNSNGSFTYTPTSNYNGTDAFTYKANDGKVDSNTATVNITINAVNDTPVAVNDAYSTNEDTVLNRAVPGVLSNDTDADGDNLTAVKVNDPAYGTLTLNSNGSFTYTPNANYNGTDSFTYRANDGQANSNTATVTITITAVNDPPVAVNDAYSTNKDTVLNVAAPGVLGNDTDVEGSTLTATKMSNPSHGMVTLNANGSFTYTPSSGYIGADSFTYQANDGQANSNTVTVTITITASSNNPPVAVNDAYITNEDTALNVAAPGVLTNDTDPNGDNLTAVKVSDPAHGMVTLNSNGSFIYTPTANYNGTDSFTYRANDGQANSNTATITITISAVNDAPMATADSYSTSQDTVLNVAAPGVLGNDTDVEGSTLTATKVNNPSHGTVTLNSNGSFTYTPSAGYTGTDSFTYRARDGQANSNTVTVTINVSTGNNTPVAANDTYTTNEDTALNIDAPGVLSNDSDSDGDTLNTVKMSDPSHGTLTLNSNGSLTYTPASGYSGVDSFTYRASDGQVNSNTATVTITVNAVNDSPVAVNDAYSTDEDTALNISAPGVLSNDTDADGDNLTAIKVSDPSHGTLTLNSNGSFTYTPSAGYTGADSFAYQASDGQANSNTATVTITVNASNSEPSPSGDNGGGGGGSGGATMLLDSMTMNGMIVSEVTAADVEDRVRIIIPRGTLVKNKNGGNVNSIHIIPAAEQVTAAWGSRDIIPCYDIQPTSATFKPSATIVFRYKDSEIPEEISKNKLYIALWDPVTREWTDLGGTVDTNAKTVSAPLNHLSVYALMAHVSQASFEVSDFTLTPREAGLGDTITISSVVKNTGDLTGTYEVGLKLDNTITQTKKVTLAGGDSETVTFTITSDIAGEHQVGIGDNLATFVVKAPQAPQAPATFTVSELNITPTEANPGGSLEISVLVTNVGDLPGRYQAVLQIDGVPAQTKDVSISGGDRTIVRFSITQDAAGQHQANIGGLQGTYNIQPPPIAPVQEPLQPRLEISSFSVAPSYDEAINKLVGTRIVYQMNQPSESFPEDRLILKVFFEDQLLETVPLLTLSQLQSDGKTGELSYVPSAGWMTGKYTFQAELYEGESLIQDMPSPPLIVTSELITKAVSWKTLGIVVGITLLLTMVIVAIILYHKRDMLRDYRSNSDLDG
jgi:VCBS repeat-containing protein